MNKIEFQWLTEPLSKVLTGEGVFVICLFLALVFGTIYYYNRSRQLLNSLPGLFTSLGLLGTFVAICNSLGTINENALEIDVIIRNLVPAFTSSIAGLISAFLATAGCKIWYSIEDKKLDDKVDKKTPEECLHILTILSTQTNDKMSTISQQLIDIADRNDTYNERLNTTISQQSKIFEQFINDFVKRMDDIFTKMHGQIEQNIKDFGEEQFKKCADTLEVLTNKMSSLSSGLLEEQKINVQQMIVGTNAELKYVSNTMTEQIKELCNQMSSALSSLRTSQDERLTAIVSNYDILSERLTMQNSEFAEKINTHMQDRFEKMQQHSVESLQQMVDLKEAFAEVNQKILQSSTSMNREVSEELRNFLSTFIEDLKNTVTEEVCALNTAIATNVQNLEKSYSYISEHVANIKGNYESAAEAYIDAVNAAHRMNENQENMLKTIDNGMKHVVKTNEKVDEILAVIENRQERIENLISHINEISTTIEALQKLELQLNKIANK